MFECEEIWDVRWVVKNQFCNSVSTPVHLKSTESVHLLRGRSMNSKSAAYPRFRLFTPNPPDFFLRVFADEKKPADRLASMLAD